MITLDRFKTSTLFRLGLAAMALRGVLQLLIDRSGHSNDLTDFALGMLFGIGAGLLLLVAWRSGRPPRGESSGT